MKNNKAEEISDMLAMYMISGKAMPDNLIDDLMREVCEEEKQKRQRDKSSHSQTNLA